MRARRRFCASRAPFGTSLAPSPDCCTSPARAQPATVPSAPRKSASCSRQASAQDPEIFSRRLLETHLQESDPKKRFDLFYGTEIRARHTNGFIYAFERLLKRAEEVDREHMLRDSLMAGGHGFIYRLMKQHQANAPAALADMHATGTHIDF